MLQAAGAAAAAAAAGNGGVDDEDEQEAGPGAAVLSSLEQQELQVEAKLLLYGLMKDIYDRCVPYTEFPSYLHARGLLSHIRD